MQGEENAMVTSTSTSRRTAATEASRPLAASERQPDRPAGSPAHLDVERGPNWLFVRVKECLPGDSEALPLAERVASVLDQHFIYRVVLELEEAALPCDQLIAQLRALEQWVHDHDGVLRVCGLPSRYARPLRRSRLTDRLPLYHDREEAVWGGPRPWPPR
jgi:hypothetical protein